MLHPRKLSKCSSGMDNAERDRISELPNEILYSILSNLTLKDSVRTSVLSHRWKDVSNSLPILRFDRFNIFPLGQKYQWLAPHEYPCRLYQQRFVNAVNQYIKVYKGTSLHSFIVSFCFSCTFTFHIDRWVSFATSKGVKHLVLKFYCDHDSYSPEQSYVLTTSQMEERFTNHFSFLETLSLSYLNLAMFDLQSFFSYWVKLENLDFKHCTLPGKLCLSSLLNLKRFHHSDCSGTKEIEFSNPNLVDLALHYKASVSSEVIKFNFGGVPNLKKLSHSVIHTRILHFFHRVPSELPKVETLTVRIGTDWVTNVPRNITTFSSVTRLKLSFTLKLRFSMPKLVSILKAFPRLRMFQLLVNCFGNERRMHQIRPRPDVYVIEHLEVAEIALFNDTLSQIEFGEYLLKCAVSLKKLVILQNLERCPSGMPSWMEANRRFVYEKLREFSKDVELEVGNLKLY